MSLRPREPFENPGEEAMRLVALREHALTSLRELSHDLTMSVDLFDVADTLLLNLMGQLGTSRAALWLDSSRGERPPVLTRQHGFGPQAARAIGNACARTVMERFARTQAPLLGAELDEAVGPAARLAREAQLEVFAAVPARGEVVGFLALGQRVGGVSYTEVEVGTLQAALGMVGVTIQNLNLYNGIAESNRRLRQANEHLQELDELKSEFIQTVNHELRTPLTIILAYVDMLQNSDEAWHKAREFVNVVEEEAVKLRGLIETLLTFSAVQSKRLAVELVSGSLQEPMARLHEERLPGVTAGLRELHFTCDPGMPAARYDERRVLEMVDALVDNAVKFTPEGSRILVRVGKAAYEGKEWATVNVEDNGPGITPDAMKALFEPFSQADGSTTRAAGGMGLGLAVARQLAHSMGGDMVVTSVLGQGSIFSILLPLAQVASPTGRGEDGDVQPLAKDAA